MHAISVYMIQCLIGYIIIGIGVYTFDRILFSSNQGWFSRLYRFVYRVTHRDPLPADVDQGFVYNRKAKVRFSWACLISIILSLLMFFGYSKNPVVEFFMCIFEIPAMMFGFWVGGKSYNFIRRPEKVFATVDQIESGEIDLGEKASGFFSRLWEKAIGSIIRIWRGQEEEKSEKTFSEALTEAEIVPVVDLQEEVEPVIEESEPKPEPEPEPESKPEPQPEPEPEPQKDWRDELADIRKRKRRKANDRS